VTIDLFGRDQSSNAATFYVAGLKGRFDERPSATTITGCPDATYNVLEVADGRLRRSATRRC
jgi:benzoyl-CoA 2,3-dioxygenase component B